MTDHVANRKLMIEALRREFVGPDPMGCEIEVSEALAVDDEDADKRPYRQKNTGEEILTKDSPVKRYGVGVLFPIRSSVPEDGVRARDESEGDFFGASTDGASEAPAIEDVRIRGEYDSDDFDLSMANAYQPSGIGVSFLAEIPTDASLVVEVTGGRYSKRSVLVRGKGGKQFRRAWWLRAPVSFHAEFPAADLLGAGIRQAVAADDHVRNHQPLIDVENVDGLNLRIEVLSRPHQNHQHLRLLTVCVVNRTVTDGRGVPNQESLFQASFSARVRSSSDDPCILPYPTAEAVGDDEKRGLELLYRHAPTFATGHGCAADWQASPYSQRVAAVSAACLPVVETPNITPDITRLDGTSLVVSMSSLAGLNPEDDGWASLNEVVDLYEEWIERQRVVAEGPLLPERYRDAARDHIAQCASAAKRMREGLAYLAEDERAKEAFQLANHAILLQQLTARDRLRKISYDTGEQRYAFAGEYEEPNPLGLSSGRGQWRAFQIAFLLTSLRSAANGTAPDRNVVELIWFPTGGGKTEAYLGLAAFSMFKRRLEDPRDTGVSVLMRYTLRLLTAQQFQRASGLICAMERLRADQSAVLGHTPFSIGIWLGRDTTPNSREAADKALTDLAASRNAENPFLLTRCPWCGAEFGRLEVPARAGTRKRRTALTPGYDRYQGPRIGANRVGARLHRAFASPRASRCRRT